VAGGWDPLVLGYGLSLLRLLVSRRWGLARGSEGLVSNVPFFVVMEGGGKLLLLLMGWRCGEV